ncbi:MAG UNVERIFIED_CONTAM: hypothetical protein LVR18_23870 [Planctomycetaceae bacterium]
MSFISVFREVAAAPLPSLMSRTPPARRLHHLIMRPRTPVNEPVAEHDRGVVHRLRDYIGPQFFITAVRQQGAAGITHDATSGL